IAYPVLLSMPLGTKQPKQDITLLHHQKSWRDRHYEENLDPSAFTWKVIETLLTLPKDDKNDNIVPIPSMYPTAYALVSLDTDNTLIYPLANKETVFIYSLVFLMNQMDKTLDRTTVLDFLNRDWKSLLKQWYSELKNYTDLLPSLFQEEIEL